MEDKCRYCKHSYLEDEEFKCLICVDQSNICEKFELSNYLLNDVEIKKENNFTIKLLVLDRNDRLNIVKDNETFINIAKNLKEECDELIIELKNNNLENIIGEMFDVQQVIIGLGDKLKNETKSELENGIKIHNAKLKGRGWEFKKRHLEVREI